MNEQTERFKRHLPLGFALVLLLLLINAFITFRNLHHLEKSYDEVARTYDVINLLDRVFSGIQDAETGQRGYLLTGREDYLEPYKKALRSVPVNLRLLHSQRLSKPMRQRMPTLQNYIHLRMNHMTTLIRARRAGENLTEKHSGSVSSGKHYMDTIRRLVVEMRREEFASLKQRVVNAQHALAVTVTSFGLATLTGIVLLVAFFNLIQRDLAVQLRHEARLIAARDEAERANQAKSEFISTVSHELRTPLNAITGFSKLLLDPRIGPLNEDQEAYTRDIVGSSDHLLQLINDILDISKIEAGKMTLDIAPFDLSELLHQTPGIVREKAQQKGIELQVKIPEDVTALPLLIADRRKVKQVLYNLLSNAVKFTPVGGRVTLEAQRGLPIGAPAPPDSNVAGNDAPFVTVIVQDTGIGILPENQQRIWNAFEQVDSSESRQFQGTGLGLALTRRMVELHGGLMWLESEFGRGSTFFFSLPLQPPPGILADNSDATERENFAQDTT